jgi:predicted RNA-binding protein with PUA-like domain
MFGERAIHRPPVLRNVMNYWLMKSEPDVYPYEQLVADGKTHWDGVRNYQARNMMRDAMKTDDLVLFYHSNTKPPHVAGVAKVVNEGYPDFTSWDADGHYFDPKSTPDNPRWFMVDLAPVHGFETIVSLPDMKANPRLEGMPLLRKGQRLSVQPVDEGYFYEVLAMAGLSRSELNE